MTNGKGRMGECPSRSPFVIWDLSFVIAPRFGEVLIWWGEAPERLLVFSKSLVTFGDIIRKG